MPRKAHSHHRPACERVRRLPLDLDRRSSSDSTVVFNRSSDSSNSSDSSHQTVVLNRSSVRASAFITSSSHQKESRFHESEVHVHVFGTPCSRCNPGAATAAPPATTCDLVGTSGDRRNPKAKATRSARVPRGRRIQTQQTPCCNSVGRFGEEVSQTVGVVGTLLMLPPSGVSSHSPKSFCSRTGNGRIIP